jgi:magnesium-transporting ATPase (P-type)
VLFRDAETLERAVGITAVVFDKTGTLTRATPTLTDALGLGDGDLDEALRLAAAVEAQSDHPPRPGHRAGRRGARAVVPRGDRRDSAAGGSG